MEAANTSDDPNSYKNQSNQSPRMPLAFSLDRGTDQINESCVSGASVAFKLDQVKYSSNVVTDQDYSNGAFSNKRPSLVKPQITKVNV